MELRIQYNDALPMIDFGEFMNGSDSCDLSHKEILAGAKGESEELKDCDADMCYNHLCNELWSFVEKPLRHWNGWTKRWYIEEFLKLMGFSFGKERGMFCVYYNGKRI